MKVTIYHNAECGTSRNALLAIRAAGHEPVIVEYMRTPLRREEIAALIALAGLSVRDAARRSEKLYREMELDRRDAGAEEILNALVENPGLLNRPFVTVKHDNGKTVAALCRPSERVRMLLQVPDAA
jgi:arsenate reductase